MNVFKQNVSWVTVRDERRSWRRSADTDMSCSTELQEEYILGRRVESRKGDLGKTKLRESAGKIDRKRVGARAREKSGGSEGSPGYIGSRVCRPHVFQEHACGAKHCTVSIQICPDHSSKASDVIPHQSNTASTELKQVYFQRAGDSWSDATLGTDIYGGWSVSNYVWLPKVCNPSKCPSSWNSPWDRCLF